MSSCGVHKRDFVFRITSGQCWYCGKEANTIDHMVPLAKGGKNRYGNLVPACRSCNGNKAGHDVEEYRRRIIYGRNLTNHNFYGEINNFSPLMPVRCMSWNGYFGSLEEQFWFQNLYRIARRHFRKIIGKRFKKIKKYVTRTWFNTNQPAR
jgi:hypothetical protein